jgi:hypothetical protein
MSNVVTLKFLGLALLSGALCALGGCSAAPYTPAGSAGVTGTYYPYASGPMPGDFYPYASPVSPAPGPPSQLQAP